MKGRWLVVALALAAACAFAFSVQLGRWWALGDVEIGPFGSRHCFGVGECKLGGLAWVGGGDRWMRLGIATWGAGLVSAFMLVVLAAGLAAKRVPKLVAKSVMISLGVAALTGTAFVVTYPGVEGAAPARGVVIFVVAFVLALAAAVLVLKTRRA
ncbi:MAG TPA: hypothetical protein VK427_05590 [Kofleriaceae bacterium]|nr:hypothetical protein [Kofleriaceae bacterium]